MKLCLPFFLLFTLTQLTYGQPMRRGGHVGGGDASASDLQYFINQLNNYLLTEEGKESFPELEQPKFHKVVSEVRPIVKDEAVYDSFGVEQTCISHAVQSNRYIKCNLRRLPSLELNNQPTYYRLVFHELLFQVGIERPISAHVPSDFRVSSRLKLYLTSTNEWLPGDGSKTVFDTCLRRAEYELYKTNTLKTELVESQKILRGHASAQYKSSNSGRRQRKKY
jgi:hypothetical protein